VNIAAVWARCTGLAAAGVIAVVGLAGPAQADKRPYVSTSSADMFWCTSVQSLCTSTTVTTIPGERR
jgi:hypothetical protein